ncbi:hypothetical protein ALC60_12229 [Trachymyrmex zeteki]|uniref:Uncharacterized protein n=1 Tax=Mycetomoellerius zeteki TaxID=64791 RepID=A0A151WLL1_9HYME|nr:hypothetical protein ALC60_12229 [Trachymyrmex zeteki]
MRKAKDERIRIAAAFFRNSFDEDDDDEKKDKAALTKESEESVSQIISDDDSTKVERKTSVTNAEISSKLIAPSLELATSTLYVGDRICKCLQSFESSSSSPNNVDEYAISDRRNTKEEYNTNNDVISKVETRRLAVPITDSDVVFPLLKHEDVITKESSARFQPSSIGDHPMRTPTTSTTTAKSKQSQLTPDFLKVPSGPSEHFRFSTLSERSTSTKERSDVKKVHNTVPQPLIAIIRDSFDEKSSGARRLTLPMTSSDLNRTLLNPATETSQKSPTYEDILAGTSVNPIRKSSIANAAICSSLAPSLLGAIPGVPNSLLPNGDYNLQRSATLSNLSTTSTTISDDFSIGKIGHSIEISRQSFLIFPQTLHRTDSMVSLCYRSLASYISDDNLVGLQSFLENKRVQIDDRDENGSTALILAATKGKIHFVRELINHGTDVNAEDADNWTALLCAAKEGHTEICLELLEHGADLEHRDMGGWTALMWATYKGKSATVTMLLGRGADVNAHGNFHISSLVWAAGRGYTDIVKDLIAHGTKVNVGDKYGTTALIWASRKGNIEIVDNLLKAGANVDTAGMYSWTALVVATLGNHVEVVSLLLEHKPNVNALDKDGCTALAIACREGHHEIANALLNAGAYVNIQDRAGDTNLIHAVKGGHRGVVESLLKKYADVDIAGKDKKTATYIAVEKGNIAILKLLLNANPDLEIATKDGDTPLLRAVRSRNAEIVQLLLDKKAKVSATDKKGDTVLHIAMRARSKAIVEILLRNPKNSQLLYRPNRQGETPYNIDVNHPKTMLGQIFGARRLNTNEDNENMLGYDLYSSALADILSEPSLSTPITVGLYAKWGSGKSFLLNKLREEMKNFARQWIDPVFQFSSLLFLVAAHVSLLVGITLGLALQSWIIGLSSGISLLVVVYIFLILVWYANKRYDWYWPYNLTVELTTKLNALKLLLQVIFCHPPGSQCHDGIAVQPIKFYFTDQTRVGTTAAGENAVVQMVGSLYDSIENDYGSLSTRLYRAFRPKPDKSTTTWKWRRLCCLPYVVIFEFCLCSLLVGISILTVYLIDISNNKSTIDRVTAHIIMISIVLVLAISIIANLYTWSRTLQALVFSQRRHLQRSIAKLETLKSEGFIQTLKSEVNLMTEMVKCLDSFMAQQSRLVVIVDGLDSCEQDKVLLVLDAIQALFSDNGYPFVVILAIDPHIISKAVEVNSRRLFSESNIGGHDYLRNMVHLPFYLQNSGLRKVKVAQQTAQYYKKTAWTEAEESVNYTATSTMHHSVSSRRLSTESAIMNSNEKLKPQPRKGSRKMRLSESIASSIGSNLNRLGGAQDLNKMLLTDDYFSDVNPRSMRRLMNVVYVTGRLLKAFQIDFNWYHLASWINITEQWPFRTSWLILHYDLYEETLDDNMSLKSLYDKVRPQIPVLKEVQPLLEIDRDERKLDVFLTFHRTSTNRHAKLVKQSSLQGSVPPTPSYNLLLYFYLQSEILEIKLSSLSVNGVCDLIDKVESLNSIQAPIYKQAIKENNINGRVLLHCDLQELKKVFKMTFGDWELFRMVIVSLREMELSSFTYEESPRSVRFTVGSEQILRKDHALPNNSIRVSAHVEKEKGASRTDGSTRRDQNKQSIMEKQVTLEEQMICGALQTLNEEACEDVLDVPSPAVAPTTDSLSSGEPTPLPLTLPLVIVQEPPQPDQNSDTSAEYRPVISVHDTEYVLLQASPLFHWVPINDEPGSSDDSSHDSTIFLQRTNSQRSITSQRSTRSARSHKNLKRSGSNISTRPSSLFISPPSSPKPAIRSKSTDERCMGNNISQKTTPSSVSTKRRSSSTFNDEVMISVPTSSLEKLSRLKDRLIGTAPMAGSPAHGGESDDESTPLVSEMSTPTHSQSDSVFKHDCSAENSSPSSNRSLPRDGERHVDLDYSDTVSLVIRESSSAQSHSRHNAKSRNDTETPV